MVYFCKSAKYFVLYFVFVFPVRAYIFAHWSSVACLPAGRINTHRDSWWGTCLFFNYRSRHLILRLCHVISNELFALCLQKYDYITIFISKTLKLEGIVTLLSIITTTVFVYSLYSGWGSGETWVWFLPT